MSDLPSVALLGFALAASPGPVNVLAFARGLQLGAARAVFLTLGANTADVLYAILVILGAGPLVNRPAAQVTLSIGGGLFLANLGITNLRKAWRQQPGLPIAERSDNSLAAAFREGFLVALMSPLTIIFWMSVFGGYYAEATARGSLTAPALLLIVLLLGGGLWTFFAALAIHFGRKTLRGRGYAVLVTLLSIVLLIFAARLLCAGVLMASGHRTLPPSKKLG